MSDKKVRLAYGAASNITFHGHIELDCTREEWDEMSYEEQDAITTQALYDLVEIWVEDDE